MSSPQLESGLTRAARYLVPFVLLSIPLWRTKINDTVPEPYMDEVFHVRQAQAYWAHNWTQWDPKITTPPGLYLWSYLLCSCIRFLRGEPVELSTPDLRATNVAAMSIILPWRLQILLDYLRKERNTRPTGAWLSQAVLNICLFPPLFFLSGLYYTDVLALLVVIEAYIWDIKRTSDGKDSLLGTPAFLALGLAALVFRQTNIFWVSVFFGGLRAVQKLREVCRQCKSSEFSEIAKKSSQNELYDPIVDEASISDYFKTSLSLVIAGLSNLPHLIVALVPYFIILAAFGAFVLWNGGVVLGHKEYHAVGFHLPQMFYIWPYFVFFSWPILLVPLINLIVPNAHIPKFLNYDFSEKKKGLPALLTALAIVPVMLAVVHFNTIVHPFTLADNRHYTFYAFRILFRYHPAVKYAAVFIYFLCSWAVLSAFGFSTPPPQPQYIQIPSSSPAPNQPPPLTKKQEKQEAKKRAKKEAQKAGLSPAASVKQAAKATQQAPKPQPQQQQISPETLAKVREHLIQRQLQQRQPLRVSFVLIWLATTALSLTTAPLVEPRYFIIPWVMWRLHIPPQPTPSMYRKQHTRDEKGLFISKLVTNFPLVLETLWFVAINVVTGYLFLYKGFEWPQEPGKVQRFMW